MLVNVAVLSRGTLLLQKLVDQLTNYLVSSSRCHRYSLLCLELDWLRRDRFITRVTTKSTTQRTRVLTIIDRGRNIQVGHGIPRRDYWTLRLLTLGKNSTTGTFKGPYCKSPGAALQSNRYKEGGSDWILYQ